MMNNNERSENISTGVDGLDELLYGGLHPQVNIMVEGLPGTGKSIIGLQFILAGIRVGESGVYISLEETPVRLYRDALSFGWDLRKLESEDKLRVIATSPNSLLDQVEHAGPLIEAIHEIGAQRCVLDPVNMLDAVCPTAAEFRTMLASLMRGFEREGLRLMIIRDKEPSGVVTSYGYWSRFTADALVSLNTETVHAREERRLMTVVKSRGQSHYDGHHAYKITDEGLKVFPRVFPVSCRAVPHSEERIASGVTGLDEMLGGGLICRHPMLISGPSGSGKTLLMLSLTAEMARRGERVLFITGEESVEETVSHASAIGLDIRGFMQNGLIDMESIGEVGLTMDEYLYTIRKKLMDNIYACVAIDNINILDRISPHPRYIPKALGYLLELQKRAGVTPIASYEMSVASSAVEVTRMSISALASTIIVLRLVEVDSEIRKGISILKHRGSAHSTSIGELCIDSDGMRVLPCFEGYSGMVSGHRRATGSHTGSHDG